MPTHTKSRPARHVRRHPKPIARVKVVASPPSPSPEPIPTPPAIPDPKIAQCEARCASLKGALEKIAALSTGNTIGNDARSIAQIAKDALAA